MDISQSGILITNSAMISGKPIDAHDTAAANAMVLSSNIGRIIQFSGQTAGSFTHNAIYIVAADD